MINPRKKIILSTRLRKGGCQFGIAESTAERDQAPDEPERHQSKVRMDADNLKTETGKHTDANHVGDHYVGGGKPGDFLVSHAIAASPCHLLVEAFPAGKAKTK